MDAELFSQLITNFGFPIVCVFAMAIALRKLWSNSEERSREREEKLYEVITRAQLQNEELSETNSKFVAILETYKSDLEEIKNDVIDIKYQISKE